LLPDPLHHQDILDGLSSLDFETLKNRGEVDTALSGYIKDIGVRMFLMKNLFWKQKGELGLRMNLNSLMINSQEIGVEISEDFVYLGETLFVKGEKSNYIVKEDNDRIKRQFPNSKLKEISKAGHWLHAENPSEFLATTLNFVKN